MKISGARSFAFRGEPDHLIALRITADGIEEVYNGEWAPVAPLYAEKVKASNGQKSISLSKLKELNRLVKNRIPQVRDFPPIA